MRTIRELLYNSAKYSDSEHILLRVAETEDTVQFIIEDVGTALPDDMQDQLFKPFTKVDNMSEGFGLGLPLCKRHADGLGGNLIYDSNYKEGCRFIFELPK
jgi:signal transduction histidine kinase